MKVTEHIAKAKDTLFSFEILPPLKGNTIDSICETMDVLMDFNPAFVDVTYHREEFVYQDQGDGSCRLHQQARALSLWWEQAETVCCDCNDRGPPPRLPR